MVARWPSPKNAKANVVPHRQNDTKDDIVQKERRHIAALGNLGNIFKLVSTPVRALHGSSSSSSSSRPPHLVGPTFSAKNGFFVLLDFFMVFYAYDGNLISSPEADLLGVLGFVRSLKQKDVLKCPLLLFGVLQFHMVFQT